MVHGGWASGGQVSSVGGIWWDGGNVIGGPGRMYRFDSESVTLGKRVQAGTQI